jgi:hypothetical protein
MKIKLEQILITLERVEGVDVHDFFYKYRTGRYVNDYEIMRELKHNKLDESYYLISRYLDIYYDDFSKASIGELKEKGWITKTSIEKAYKIKSLIINK